MSSSVVVDSVLNYAYTGSSQNVELLPGNTNLKSGEHKEDIVLHLHMEEEVAILLELLH